MTTPARLERWTLCDLFAEVGPDAPTLCGEWTTRDLAAHLVVRERRADGAIGIVASPFAGHGERVRRGEAERDYESIVERVRCGPPWWSPMAVPAVDRLVNTVEFFVHHEDVRRGTDGWTPRQLDAALTADLDRALRRGARMLARHCPVGLTVRPDGADEIVAKRPKGAEGVVIAGGDIGELVLFLYGRQHHAIVEIEGQPDDIAAVESASFGI